MPRRKTSTPPEAEFYQHPEAESLLRPDVGTQAQFRKKKPPQKYRYDSSLAPELQWDGQNAAREEGEQRLAVVTDQLSEIRKKLSGAEIQKLFAENPQLSNEAIARLVAENLDEAEEALRELKAMSGPFLNWAGQTWEHFTGDKSQPFEAGEHKQIAVKVIDYRGNELLVVESLKES